jgi:hypothetical protein
MSRIDELKKQHPNYALSAIDIYKMISPGQTNKYVEMLIKLDKNIEYDYPGDHRARLIEEMTGNWGLDYNYLETFDLETLIFLVHSVNSLMQGKISLFTKFASLNERKLINNNDVTTYSTWDEIVQAVALAELKLIDKETAKQIKKIYEDDEWLSLRPLSLEASMKYGANTKWCTTTESGQYYARYSSRGILIYNINKKTGYKVACFKNLSPDHDNEFSWWDVTDKKIEVLDSEAPAAVLEAIRNEIKTTTVSNQMLMTKAESDKLEAYKNGSISQPEEPRLHISGGLNYYPGSTTTNTLVYNPSTSTSSNTLTYNSSGNVGISNINPTTQLSVNGGNIEVNDGDVILRSDGVERARLTANGLEFTPGRQYNHYDRPLTNEDQLRIIRELASELNDGDRIAADAQQRLDDAMAEQLAVANERVAEKHLSFLENIEMGTLGIDAIQRMQRLAGVETLEQRLARLDAERERMISDARRTDDEAAEQWKAERKALTEEVNVAEQPVVPSKHSWIDKIKSGYEKIKVYITRSKMAKGTK